jgi:hypothetical protein
MVSSSSSERQQGSRLIEALSADSAMTVAYLLRRWRASPSAAESVYLTLIANPARRNDVDTAGTREWLASLYLQRGRLREARPLVPMDLLELVPMNLVSFGRYGIVPVDSITAIARVWAGQPNFELRHAAVVWFGGIRDSTALRTIAAHERKDRQWRSRSAADSVAAVYLRSLVQAYLALVTSDSAGAQARFHRLPDSLCTWACAQEVGDAAALFVARGDVRGAAQLLDRHPPANNPWAFVELPWIVQRSSVGRLLGDSLVVARLRRPLRELSLNADTAVALR